MTRRPSTDQAQTTASFAMQHIQKLEKSFEFARENISKTQNRMKETYDLGVNRHVFKPGDSVRIKLKTLGSKPASKLRSPWSNPFEVVACDGVVVTLRDPVNNAQIRVHADRLCNVSVKLRPEPSISHPQPDPVISDPATSNPVNTAHLSDYSSPASDSDSADSDSIIPRNLRELRSRHPNKRAIKSTKHPDFVYDLLLMHSEGIKERPPSEDVGANGGGPPLLPTQGVPAVLQTALLRHAGSHESVARDSSTDVRFVQSGTQLATPSPTARTPAILPPAKPMDEGVFGADVVEPVSSDVFASRVVTSVQPGRRSRRGRGSMAKVGSPGFLVATSWLVEEVLVKGATEEHGNEA